MASSYQYTVIFQNNTTNAGSACLYQPSTKFSSVAWLVQYAYPSARVAFTWTLDWDFVWSQTGPLAAGAMAQAAQVWPTDLSTNNQVNFTVSQALTFTGQQAGPASGSLAIHQDDTIPINTASIGLGMAGSPVLLVQAAPNIDQVFIPEPRYRIAFGTFSQGEVLLGFIAGSHEIVFPPSIYSMTATLNADLSWTVVPTPSANEALAVARATNSQATWKDVVGQ